MVHVFYGRQLYGSYLSWKEMHMHINGGETSDIYNGGYIYCPDHKYTKWFRGDMTPCLIEDVPKQIQMMALVLNL